MSEPIFPEVVIGPLAYIMIGLLTGLVIFLSAYIYRIKSSKKTGFDVKQLKMPESRLIILENVLEKNIMQNRLPEKTNYSKSTVSQAIKELRDQGLIKKKKRGNSYLIEPNIDKIEEELERV